MYSGSTWVQIIEKGFVALATVQTQSIYSREPYDLFITVGKMWLTFDSLAAYGSQAVRVLHQCCCWRSCWVAGTFWDCPVWWSTGAAGELSSLCVNCIGVCMTARRSGSGSCGCWQDDRFCMWFMALQMLITPTMRRCRENVPFFPCETVMVFCGNDRKGERKAFIRSSSHELQWRWNG